MISSADSLNLVLYLLSSLFLAHVWQAAAASSTIGVTSISQLSSSTLDVSSSSSLSLSPPFVFNSSVFSSSSSSLSSSSSSSLIPISLSSASSSSPSSPSSPSSSPSLSSSSSSSSPNTPLVPTSVAASSSAAAPAPTLLTLSNFVSSVGVLTPLFTSISSSSSSSSSLSLLPPYTLTLDRSIARLRFWLHATTTATTTTSASTSAATMLFTYYVDVQPPLNATNATTAPLLVASMSMTVYGDVNAVTSFISLSTPPPPPSFRTYVNPRLIVSVNGFTLFTILIAVSTPTSFQTSSSNAVIVDCFTTGNELLDPVLYPLAYNFNTNAATVQCPPLLTCDYSTLRTFTTPSQLLIGGGGGDAVIPQYYSPSSIVCLAAAQSGLLVAVSASASVAAVNSTNTTSSSSSVTLSVNIAPSYGINSYVGTSSNGYVSVDGTLELFSVNFLSTNPPPPSNQSYVYTANTLPPAPPVSFTGGTMACDSTSYALNVDDSTPNATFIIQCPVWSLCSTLQPSQYVVDLGSANIGQDSAICMTAYARNVLSKDSVSSDDPYYAPSFALIIQPPISPSSSPALSTRPNKWSLSSSSSSSPSSSSSTSSGLSFSISVRRSIPVVYWQTSVYGLCNVTSGVHTRFVYCMNINTNALADPNDPTDAKGQICTIASGAGPKPPTTYPCTIAELSFWDVRGTCLTSIGYGTGTLGCYSVASPDTRLILLDCQSSTPFPTTLQLTCVAASWIPYVIEFCVFTVLLLIVALMIKLVPPLLSVAHGGSARDLNDVNGEANVGATVSTSKGVRRRLFPEEFVPLSKLLCDSDARLLLLSEILRQLQYNHPLFSSLYPCSFDPFNRTYRLMYLCVVLCAHFSIQAWTTWTLASSATFTDLIQKLSFIIATAFSIMFDQFFKLVFKHSARHPSQHLQIIGHLLILLTVLSFIVSLVIVCTLTKLYVRNIFVQWLGSTALSFMFSSIYLTAAVVFFNARVVKNMNVHTRVYEWTKEMREADEASRGVERGSVARASFVSSIQFGGRARGTSSASSTPGQPARFLDLSLLPSSSSSSSSSSFSIAVQPSAAALSAAAAEDKNNTIDEAESEGEREGEEKERQEDVNAKVDVNVTVNVPANANDRQVIIHSVPAPPLAPAPAPAPSPTSAISVTSAVTAAASAAPSHSRYFSQSQYDAVGQASPSNQK